MSTVLTRFSADDCVFLVGHSNLYTLSSNNREVKIVNNFPGYSIAHFINLPTKVLRV